MSVSMATRRQRKRKRGKIANAEEKQVESSLHADEENGSIRGEDMDGGSIPGKHVASRLASINTRPLYIPIYTVSRLL